MSEAVLNVSPCRGANKPAYSWTRLDGRQTTWTPQLVARLTVLWAAGFHYSTIGEVLGVTPRAVSSKATRVGLPSRQHVLALSKDADAARRFDQSGQAAPKALKLKSGREVIGKRCAMSGAWFYGLRGAHTSPESKLTERYRGTADV